MSSSLQGANRLVREYDIQPEEYGTFIRPATLYSDSEGVSCHDAARRRTVERALLRKLDLRTAFLVLVSIMNYMDRQSAAAARLNGLETDLQISGTQFNTLIGILYVGYTLMQIPSNWFLNQVARPSVYLSTGVFLWGLLSITIGASQSYYAVLISRFLLGSAEAMFSPGAIFLLSKWYTPKELGLRLAILICGSFISNASGSLIASGILSIMDNVLGVRAWRWLFYVEGFLTLILSAMSLCIIPDFPSSPASWLTQEEHLLAKIRTEVDPYSLERAPPDGTKYSSLWAVVADWKIWWLGISVCGVLVAISFGNFFPTLSATMGYSPTVTLWLCAPPWLIAAATSFIVTRHSDSTGERFWHITAALISGVFGFLLAISTMNPTIRYISFFFMTQAQIAYVLLMAWASNSIPESSKRAVCIAFIGTIATCGNAGASYIWPSFWGPTYTNSFIICALASLLSITMCWIFRSHLARLNKEADMTESMSRLPKGFRYLL